MNGEVSAGVAAFIALLGFALLVSIAAERVHVAPAVLLVAVGAVCGSIWHVRPPFSFGPALLFIFLPPLIFEAAWNIDLRTLRKCASRVVVFAVGGTLFSTFAVAGAVASAGALPFAASLLLGAIVSATDPVAVVAVFRSVNVPASIKTLVEAESIANDGIAVVVYSAALTLSTSGSFAPGPAVAHGLLAIAVGTAVGIAAAMLLWLLLRMTRSSAYEVTATVSLAYIAYLVADHLGASGIFATASAAVTLRALLLQHAHLSNRDAVDVFWNSVAYIVNATVFLASGLVINGPRALHEPLLIVAAIVAVAASRALFSFCSARIWAERITIFLAGMRGALPLALALALPADLAQRPAIIDGVFAVVLVTLVLQGAPLRPIVRRLYGPQATEAPAV